MPPKRDDGVRAWCFTVNNYTDNDKALIADSGARYIIYGHEICPTTGTPHLQGYIYFKSAITLSALKKHLPRAKLIQCKGTTAHNQKYCKKEGVEIFEQGDDPKQGARNDHKSLKKILDEAPKRGKLLRVFEENFEYGIKFWRGYEKYIQLTQKPRNPDDDPPQVIWRWGLAGLGKSRWVYSTFPKEEIFSKPAGGKGQWYDNYDQHDVFLINDFDAGTLPTKELLNLLDRYPFQGAVKGGFVQITSKVFVITSDHPPSHFWAAGNDLNQVLRRLTEIVPI